MNIFRRLAGTPRTLRIVITALLLLAALALTIPEASWTTMRAVVSRDMRLLASSVMPPRDATRMLDVPFLKQERALSCEIASLRSALAAVGTEVTEAALIAELPRDTTPKRATSRTTFTWGDPEKGFVGDINGRMPSTGYGVHAPPIAQVASRYAVTTRIAANDAPAIISAINAGHPVIVWSVLGTPRHLRWTTPDGTAVSAALYEHTLVVYGYKTNSAGNIETVYVVDPRSGKRTESWKEFTWRTGFLNHQALEIHPVVL